MVKPIPVAEVFGPTVQGEGANAGRVSAFVRTGGCGYRCTWCDSMHAVDPKNANSWQRLLPAEIVSRVTDLVAPGTMVVLTGGDPCIHEGLSDVIVALHALGYETQVETQGVVCASWLGLVDSVCISPKPPSSGMVLDLDKLREVVAAADARAFLKVPVSDAEDLAFADMLAAEFPDVPFYVQPVNLESREDREPPDLMGTYRELVDIVASEPSRATWHVLPQLHVLLWGNKRGV